MVLGEERGQKAFEEEHFARDVGYVLRDEVGICAGYDGPVKEIGVISGFAQLHYHVL